MITKKTIDGDFDFQAGEVLLIDKPGGWTSFKVIREIRKAINVRKVGHAGTLDPVATGLLIVCTGKRTKEISAYQNLPKVYEGVITLGKSSPSMDTETEVTGEKPVEHITEEMILRETGKLTGKIMQVPPMYSALKVKGKPLYKMARKGKEIQRNSREVEVYEFTVLRTVIPDVWFRIRCSRGTYIRVIADDLGNNLGCGGIISSLRRTAIGEYSVDDAFLPEDFVRTIGFPNKNV